MTSKSDRVVHVVDGVEMQAPGKLPKGVGMGAQALAHEITTAVAADEAGDGCDIAAGLFGPKMSTLIRKIVTEYLGGSSKQHTKCPTPVDQTEAAEREHMGCAHCGTGIYTGMPTASVPQGGGAAVAAIEFALTADEGMEYLRCWNEGEFDACRREWPEAPSDCYIGADPLLAAPAGDDTPDAKRLLNSADLQALITFNDQYEDFEADGYTASKEAMKRLAELGLVQWLGGSRYGVTSFGSWVIERHRDQKPSLPLRTIAEANDDAIQRGGEGA